MSFVVVFCIIVCCDKVLVGGVNCGCNVAFGIDAGKPVICGGNPAIELKGLNSSSVVGAKPPDRTIITIKIKTGIDKNIQITRHFKATLRGDAFVFRALLDGSAN